MPSYDDIRTTLTRLEAAGAPAPDLSLSYFNPNDEQVGIILDALDTFAWRVDHAGNVWIAGSDGKTIKVTMYLRDRDGTRPKPPEPPLVAHARALLDAHPSTV